MSGRARAIAWHRASHAAICDRVVPWAHGTAVYASDVPSFWDYNSVRVEGADPDLTADELIAVADRLQAELAHRQVEIEDEAAGDRVRPVFEAHGWMAERLVWMELIGPVPDSPAVAEISEVPFPGTRPLREAWFLSSDWAPTPEAARSFMEVEERVAARAGKRAMVAWGAGGEPIGYVSFCAAKGAAEVEQVYVEPRHRGGGTGTALVTAAVQAAGAASTLIVADDEEDAKRLYARLGFRPVWIHHVFTRRPGAD
jgi:GNAT superfamily N-acetyltransferase